MYESTICEDRRTGPYDATGFRHRSTAFATDHMIEHIKGLLYSYAEGVAKQVNSEVQGIERMKIIACALVRLVCSQQQGTYAVNDHEKQELKRFYKNLRLDDLLEACAAKIIAANEGDDTNQDESEWERETIEALHTKWENTDYDIDESPLLFDRPRTCDVPVRKMKRAHSVAGILPQRNSNVASERWEDIADIKCSSLTTSGGSSTSTSTNSAPHTPEGFDHNIEP